MAIREFLENHEVFTTADFEQQFPQSPTDRNLLSRAVKNGNVQRVRRGLYVSKCGPYMKSTPDPVIIAHAAAEDSVFCYSTALRLHGIAHNVFFTTQFYTHMSLSAFTFGRQGFEPIAFPMRGVRSRLRNTEQGITVHVTTIEQTLVDCVAKPWCAGGGENVMRSLSAIRRLDSSQVYDLSTGYPNSAAARIGYILELGSNMWSVPDDIIERLHSRVGKGTYRFDRASGPSAHHWVGRWRLYLPAPQQEVASWLTT